jgi:hypothetical protein
MGTSNERHAAVAKRKLSPALARRAAQAARHKLEWLRARGRELVALIKRRKRVITEAFYDIGDALAELKRPDMLRALGRRSFDEAVA